MKFSGEPIFVVCYPRSGSTLLRYILDTHADIVCPPELHLASLIQQLERVYRILKTDQRNPPDRMVLDQKIASEIRRTIDSMIHDACSDPPKKRWCEKSVSTLDSLPMKTAIYPDAQFICLHRHCMDFVHSALATLSHAWGYGYEDFLFSRRHNDVVDSLVLYWCERTEAILQFEKHFGRCFSLKYESLVTDPAESCKRLFAYLGASDDPGLPERVFSSRHQAGPGDPKIYLTRRIHADSVATGRSIPVRRIASPSRDRMNALLRSLGYEQVGGDWNA